MSEQNETEGNTSAEHEFYARAVVELTSIRDLWLRDAERFLHGLDYSTAGECYIQVYALTRVISHFEEMRLENE